MTARVIFLVAMSALSRFQDLAAAQDPCVVDQDTGPVTTQVRACSQRQYELATADLEKLRRDVRVLVAADADRRRAWEEAEAAWLPYLRTGCEAAYLEIFPGSLASAVRFDCLARLTRERIAAVARTYFSDR